MRRLIMQSAINTTLGAFVGATMIVGLVAALV